MNTDDLKSLMLFGASISVDKAVLFAKGEIAALQLAMTRSAASMAGVTPAELDKARADIGLGTSTP